MKTWYFSRRKKKVQIQIKSKIIYLNADFWFAGLNYYDLNEMHPFYLKRFAAILLQFFFSTGSLN